MMVYTTTSLVYSKDYMFTLRPICVRHIVMTTFFSVTSWLVTVTVIMLSDVTDVWQHGHDITTNPNSKFKIKK